MTFSETTVQGAFLIGIERKYDERGSFARSWCCREFETQGLNPITVQCNISFNEHKGTLRGMHYQKAPHEEAKLVRCTRGSIYDVVVDLRPDSPTFQKYYGAILTSENACALYIPEGCAHGFLTLEDQTEVFYHMSEFFAPGASHGFRWNDPAFAIAWPLEVSVISERDRTYPNYER